MPQLFTVSPLRHLSPHQQSGFGFHSVIYHEPPYRAILIQPGPAPTCRVKKTGAIIRSPPPDSLSPLSVPAYGERAGAMGAARG